MKHIAHCLAFAALIVLIGCDTKPSAPRTADGKVFDVLTVSPGDQAEQTAVTAAETSRINYEYRPERPGRLLRQRRAGRQGRLD